MTSDTIVASLFSGATVLLGKIVWDWLISSRSNGSVARLQKELEDIDAKFERMRSIAEELNNKFLVTQEKVNNTALEILNIRPRLHELTNHVNRLTLAEEARRKH